MIDATDGHLVPDSEEYLRGLLDNYDASSAVGDHRGEGPSGVMADPP
jgi:hypothetical protein